ncbi:MAG: sterol desaturase family protein [Marivita sp.]|uniref:sterol desaturase family protein n=1 Tax=Marivita sp. TaxID=2003365 RepID=UPI001B1FF998|nr:sterol desaturase family protein [Marivita sp.]MBO6882599.1 sterol desaturase family protein [Marivita sp.]
METLQNFIAATLDAPFDFNVRYSIFYLTCTVLIAFGIWKYRGSPGTFTSWLLPKEVYRHRSNLLDIKLFFASRFFAVLGVFGAVFFPTTVAYGLLAQFGGADYAPPETTWLRIAAVTLIVVVVSDFCKYWAHRAHHEWRALWPFHAVHHSADVLTPLTVQRVHPLEPMINSLLMTLFVGIAQGLALYFLVGELSMVTIGGANAVYFLFHTLGSNFRHSHIWISYGRVMEHILISPAQHQIHHSVAVKHHDKNYGSIFAIWDWMFGTLYVPESYEDLTFGVSDAKGQRREQPYETLGAALFKPFVESAQNVLGMVRKGRPAATGTVGTARMSQGFSLWLDALRAGAALTVLFGHMAHTRFTGGDYQFLRDWNVASDAVAVFFVLSGVVIAYAAQRDGTLGRYGFNRITRIMSVLIPALMLTLVFDAVGTAKDMSAYQAPYYQDVPLGEFFWRGLTLTNLWTGTGDWVRLGSNGPIWSLSYEVAFYLIFGAVLFLTGVQRIAVLLVLVLLVGVPALALLPAWWVGVWVWRHASVLTDGHGRGRAWVLAVGSVVALVMMKMSSIPADLESFTARLLAPHDHHAILVYSNEVLWNSVIALCLALHLVGVRYLADTWPERTEGGIAKTVRWVAGGSFSLYLVHYPTLHLLDATLPETLPAYNLVFLLLTLSICFGFATLFERPIRQYRAALLKTWDRLAPHVPAMNRRSVS